MDSDLAQIYGVETKRLNQQVSRNLHKFPEDFMFQLTKEEYQSLRSQNATLEADDSYLRSQNATIEKSKRGKHRKYMPYVFTEHGVLQAANVISSDLADKVSVFVIRAFVEMREIIIAQQEIIQKKNELLKTDTEPDAKINQFFHDLKPKLYGAINNVLDTVIDKSSGTTIREEAQDILKESIHHLKEKLKKTGLENEEIAARITKILAEAEKERAIARKTNAESDQIEFIVTVRKLRLVLEAQKVLIGGETHEIQKINAFISILTELTNDQN
jgi:hypothetical protein